MTGLQSIHALLCPRWPAAWVAVLSLFACAEPRRVSPAPTGETEAPEPDAQVQRAEIDAGDATPDATEPLQQSMDAGADDAGVSAMGEASAENDGAAQAGAASDPSRRSLVLPALWMPLLATDDPFDDRPLTTRCDPSAHFAETLAAEPVFSVDTGGCAYLTVRQLTRSDVAVGEVIKVRLWHFELSAPEPAEAHAAIVIDGTSLLDERIAIPQPGALITAQMKAERAIPAGASVYFHLHNHGANSWSLVEVSAGQ